MKCFYCGYEITGSSVGCGDGTGNKFAHLECFMTKKNVGVSSGMNDIHRASKQLYDELDKIDTDNESDLISVIYNSMTPEEYQSINRARREEIYEKVLTFSNLIDRLTADEPERE